MYRRDASGRCEVLLVRGSTAPHEWVLPKGHIERGETPEQAAEREVLEEAGVVAKTLAPLDGTEFITPKGKPARVAFFLMERLDSAPACEDRETLWTSIDEAISLTPFPDLKRILAAARGAIGA